MVYPLSVFVCIAILLSGIIIWTVFGNSLVLISLYKFKQLRSNSNILIGNLAVSDILLALTVMPLSQLYDILGFWSLGYVTCNCWLTLDILYCTASVWSLVAIAFDRFTATSFPSWYREKVNNDRVTLYIAVVWILSILICLPPIIGWDGVRLRNPREIFRKNYNYNNVTNTFNCTLYSERNYVIYSSLGSFILPLIILIIFYSKIFIVIQTRAAYLRKMRNERNKTVNSPLPPADKPYPTISFHCRDSNNLPPINNDIIKNSNLLSPTTYFCNDEISASYPEQTTSVYLSNNFNTTIEDTSSSITSNDQIKYGNTNSTNINCGFVRRSTAQEQVCPNCLKSKTREQIPTNKRIGSRLANFYDDSSNSNLTHIYTEIRRLSKISFRRKSSLKLGGVSRSVKQAAKADRREQRATKRMALIIFIFILCWIPFTVMYLSRPMLLMNEHLVKFLVWLGYSNSAINPILYTVFNNDFRKAFQKILKIV